MTMKWRCPECGFELESPDTTDPYYCYGKDWDFDNPTPHEEVEMEEIE
jgi:hypothetical protein